MIEFLYSQVNQEMIAHTSKRMMSGALKYERNFMIQFIFLVFWISLYP